MVTAPVAHWITSTGDPDFWGWCACRTVTYEDTNFTVAVGRIASSIQRFVLRDVIPVPTGPIFNCDLLIALWRS